MITNMRIHSKRMEVIYDVTNFMEYEVDIDLEMDADQFNMVLSNPSGMFTGIFNKFDPVDIKVYGTGIIHGMIDEVEYISDENGNVIRIVGRDIAGILVDNDALPGTLNNVRPHEYIASKCGEYGLAHSCATTNLVDTLIVGSGESEISVMNNLLIEQFKRLWVIYDVLYEGEWNTKAEPSYKFTRGVSNDQMGIPVKYISVRDSGLDMKSEVRIYGSMNEGAEKVMGVAKNDYMISQGIKKRKTIGSSNDDSTTKYASSALRHIRDGFQSGMVVELRIRTSEAILPNRTALLIDVENKINSVFFIKAVKYTKGSGGSETTITMIPGDTTFDVIWNNQGDKKKGKITGLPTMSLSELLSSRK